MVEHWIGPRVGFVVGIVLDRPVQAVSEPYEPIEGLVRTVAKGWGYCVRLASQSSDYLPLSAVDGQRFDATQIHYGPLARTQLEPPFFSLHFKLLTHFISPLSVSGVLYIQLNLEIWFSLDDVLVVRSIFLLGFLNFCLYQRDDGDNHDSWGVTVKKKTRRLNYETFKKLLKG